MNKKVKKVKKVRINFKALLLLLLIIYVIIMLLYTFFTIKIKNIYILNTSLITDNEVILKSGLKDYPSLFKTNTKKLEDTIKEIDLVEDVKVTKKLNGKLIIDITEAKPLFYNRNNDKVVLSNGKEVEKKDVYLGIPTLVNYVPNDVYKDFVKALKSIDKDIIGMINEIFYEPDINEDVVIDNYRFKLLMNDTNIVYVNTLNIERLNNYIEIYASIASAVQNKKGTLYLDSYLSENNLFTPFTEQSSNEDKENLDDTGEDGNNGE